MAFASVLAPKVLLCFISFLSFIWTMTRIFKPNKLFPHFHVYLITETTQMKQPWCPSLYHLRQFHYLTEQRAMPQTGDPC